MDRHPVVLTRRSDGPGCITAFDVNGATVVKQVADFSITAENKSSSKDVLLYQK